MRGSLRLVAGSLLGLAIVALPAGCGEQPTAADSLSEKPALPVQVLTLESLDGYSAPELYAGRVVARRSSDLGFERAGRLDEVRVEEGDRVTQGQILARLEQRVLVARQHELAARVDEITTRLELAGLTRKRRSQLAELDSISTERFDQAVHEERALASQLRAARAAQAGVAAEVDLSLLRAPYDGTVTARLADEGTVLSPGQSLLRVIEDAQMEFRAGLPPETAGRLGPDLEPVVEIDGTAYPATLHSVVNGIDPSTRTVTVVLRFPSPPPGVEHGALGRIRIPTRFGTAGAWLPISALTESQRGLWSAFAVVGEDEELRAERRELEVIHSESDRAYVRGGLRDGDRVIATGAHRLVPGQRVRVVR